MDLGLKGKVGIVTGAARGIGKAVAFALGEEGVSVAVCALDENELERTAKERRSCVTNHLDEYKQLTLVGAEMYN